MRDGDRLIKLAESAEMRLSADLLVNLIAAGMELDAVEMEQLSDGVRRRAELGVIRRWLVADVRAGMVAGAVLAAFDEWAAVERDRFPLPMLAP